MVQIKPATNADAKTIADLARPIWEEHFIPIIGKAQVDYMLEKFQSEPAILDQMANGYAYFQVLNNSELVGYFSIQPRDSNLFISKFYLSSDYRGQGIARRMLRFIVDYGKSQECSSLELTVNKDNPACQIYQHLGFERVGSIKIEIGEGYIMNDYRMQMTIN